MAPRFANFDAMVDCTWLHPRRAREPESYKGRDVRTKISDGGVSDEERHNGFLVHGPLFPMQAIDFRCFWQDCDAVTEAEDENTDTRRSEDELDPDARIATSVPYLQCSACGQQPRCP